MPDERPSPFTVPAPTVVFTDSEPLPTRPMTVKQLVANLIGFAEFYESATAAIERADPFERPSAVAFRDSNADHSQREFRATADISRVRGHCLGEYGGELAIGTAGRLLGDLIRLHALPAETAEGLRLGDAMDRLAPPRRAHVDATSTATRPAPADGASDGGKREYTFGDLVRDLDSGRFVRGSVPAAALPETRRLELVCNRLYGEALTPGTARRLRARLVDRHRLTDDTVDLIDLQTAADLLEDVRRVTSDESQAAATGQLHHGMHNYDHLYLDNFNTKVVHVTGLSAKVVPGTTPTACRDANPAMPPSMLSAALDAVRRANALPAGTTIHWVGHDAGMRNRCRCHPNAPFAAPFDAHRWASVAAAAEAGATTTQAQPTPTVSPTTPIQLPTDPSTAVDCPPGWSELVEAKQTILEALSRSAERLQGAGVAEAAGYKPGTLRHHYGELQAWGYIDKAKDGYGITPLGKAIVACKPV